MFNKILIEIKTKQEYTLQGNWGIIFNNYQKKSNKCKKKNRMKSSSYKLSPTKPRSDCQ